MVGKKKKATNWKSLLRWVSFYAVGGPSDHYNGWTEIKIYSSHTGESAGFLLFSSFNFHWAIYYLGFPIILTVTSSITILWFSGCSPTHLNLLYWKQPINNSLKSSPLLTTYKPSNEATKLFQYHPPPPPPSCWLADSWCGGWWWWWQFCWWNVWAAKTVNNNESGKNWMPKCWK